MLSIYAITEHLDTIRTIISTEERLSELIDIYDSLEHKPVPSSTSLIINSKGIQQAIDWQNSSPPYLLPRDLPLSADTLLGLIFNLLDNGEKAWHYLQKEAVLQRDISFISRLKHGYQINVEEYASLLEEVVSQEAFEQYRIYHNAAVVHQYGYLNQSTALETIVAFYQKAIELAPNTEYQAFTLKHYTTLLVDTQQSIQAEQLIQEALKASLSEDANFGLKTVLCNSWMKRLTVPYDLDLVSNLKTLLWEVLQYLEAQGRKAEAGLLYVDAAHIANISESFSEALGYVTKAARLFEEEGLEELVGHAQLRKGTLLYTWAQNGNPQFYKAAVESYQEALKVYKNDVAPAVFADIHHNLGVLYSEMPADNKRRGIWAGVASASFQEALNYYTKEAFPYEYGMICNNFGNALTKFPLAIHSDNYEKALFYYSEALSVRTKQYPYERAISLLNFLEASWSVSNSGDSFNETRYQDMQDKANEVLILVEEPEMVEEANKHLKALDQLRTVVEKG